MRLSRSTHQLMCLFLETLTSIIRTGYPILVQLINLVNSCYNLEWPSSYMVNFPSWMPDWPALLDLFIYFDASICSTMAFPRLGNSVHVAVSVSIEFPSSSQWDAPFHRIVYDYSCADWNSLCDHLRDVPWEDFFKLIESSATSYWV